MTDASKQKYKHQIKWQLRKKAEGLCQSCGVAESNGKTLCRTCAEKILSKRRVIKYCEICEIQIKGYEHRCSAHKIDENAQQELFRKTRVKNGLCRDCGDTAIPGKSRCLPCLETNRLRSRNFYRARRIKVINLYGGKCVCCGETETDFLTLDHINNDGNEHRKKVRPGSAMYKYVLDHLPIDIQVLCYNCNCSKGYYGICPHQRYKTGEAQGERVRENRRRENG